MNFEEHYFIEVNTKEGILDIFKQKEKYPANPGLWGSIMQKAKKQFGKRDSSLKTNWVEKEYKRMGGRFA